MNHAYLKTVTGHGGDIIITRKNLPEVKAYPNIIQFFVECHFV